MKYLKYLLWIAVIAIMAVIFVFSSQESDKSSDVSEKISKIVTNGQYVPIDVTKLDEDKVNLEGIVRKTAHFTIYLALGFFLILALLCSFNKKEAYLVAVCLIICLLYAVSDEIHQLFVVGRSCELKDVIIDFSGSSIGNFISLKLKNKNIWR